MAYQPETPPPSPLFRYRLLISVAITAGLFGLGVLLLFTVGAPMGWPLDWWFNLIFIGMGAVFVGGGVNSALNPTSVTIGGGEGGYGGRSATKAEGISFGLLFVVIGLGILVFAVFMGFFLGGAEEPSWASPPMNP